MKIQCPCGAKYSVDVTPDMADRPVRFVCQACGLDSSDVVNEMVRRELSAAPPTGVLIPSTRDAPAAAPAQGGSGVRIHVATRNPVTVAPGATAEVGSQPQLCLKHPGQAITHHCLVCQKPMCPKCMELFGYVCSPFCKNRAEAQRIPVPEYAGQMAVATSRFWRKVGLISGAVGVTAAAVLGFWVWYAWFGSRPRPVFSVRFEESARSGQSQLCGRKQIVFLHGDTLYRYDLRTKQRVWSRRMVDEKGIVDAVDAELKDAQTMVTRLQERNPDANLKMPSRDELIAGMEAMAGAALQLYVQGSNIWVTTQDRLVRCDWDSGNPIQEIPVRIGFGRAIRRGDELLVMGEVDSGREGITHVNLTTAQTRVEEIGDRAMLAGGGAGRLGAIGALASGQGAGLPIGAPGTDMGKPMDPARVAAEAQRLPLAARIALPAVLAGNMSQQRALQEMEDEDNPPPKPQPAPTTAPVPETVDHFSFIPSQHGYVEFSTRLLERRLVQRKAMKEPPKKSVLDGNLRVTQSMEVANEILNEMQRNKGGDTVTEDESRYHVTVRIPGGKAPDWSAEVVGPPTLHPLKSVNVVAAAKSIVVLDKANKKLWQAELTYRIPTLFGAAEDEDSEDAHGPCVERDGRLYVFDQAVLTVFDLRTGNVQWRLPSVGISGLFFDDQGMLYVNTTTASPDTIKYARQIDVTQKTANVVVKVDPRNGKILWSAEPGGAISRISGKFIYIVSSFEADPFGGMRILDMPSYLRIRRLDPDDGRVLWEHFEQRAPLSIRFDRNTIELVFKKEVEVLKFLSF